MSNSSDSNSTAVSIKRPTGWHKWFRITLFGLLATFMHIGPCYRQAFQGRGKLPMGMEIDVRIFRRWVMFSGFGKDICDVRYYQVMADGGEEPIDRFTLLEQPEFAKAPLWIRRIENPKRVKEMGQKLCDVLKEQGTNPDLRVVARCGSYRGWVDKFDGSEKLCKKKRRRKPKKRGQR